MSNEYTGLICEIKASDLARIIAEGSMAASKPNDFPRYAETCLLETDEDYLLAVSTDGKRLALAKAPCEKVKNGEETVLSASELKKFGETLASDYTDETVKILADNSTVWFQIEGVEFPFSKMDAAFPKYRRILNNVVHTTMKFNSSDLISVLDRMNIIAVKNPAHVVVMTLNSENNEAVITARLPEYGAVREKFNAEIGQNNLQIGFNINYFLDGLKTIGNKTAVAEFSGSEAQARITRENDDSFLYLLMPVRLLPADKLDDEM